MLQKLVGIWLNIDSFCPFSLLSVRPLPLFLYTQFSLQSSDYITVALKVDDLNYYDFVADFKQCKLTLVDFVSHAVSSGNHIRQILTGNS